MSICAVGISEYNKLRTIFGNTLVGVVVAVLYPNWSTIATKDSDLLFQSHHRVEANYKCTRPPEIMMSANEVLRYAGESLLIDLSQGKLLHSE